MDDILIFGGQTKEQHHEIVIRVLNILHKHCLYLKAEKCVEIRDWTDWNRDSVSGKELNIKVS